MKIFTDWYSPRVEEGFNTWMTENESKVNIVRCEYTPSGNESKAYHTIVTCNETLARRISWCLVSS